jgi:hypothetical protein
VPGAEIAAQSLSPPDFAPSSTVGWRAYGDDFILPLSGPGPVTFDPLHPYVPECIVVIGNPARECSGKPSTFRIADLNSPILQPWAREELRKRNEQVLGGKPGYTRNVTCWPLGVPAHLLYPVAPVYFIQTAKEVLITERDDHQTRRIYLNVPHSANPKPSWHGESVGHYEDDTLVVDTIAVTTKAPVDNYRTPHTEQLHVIERFRLIDGGNTIEVSIRVEDPGAFTTPWNAIQRYSKFETEPLIERNCAENNANYFNQDLEPMPVADRPDF